MADLWTQPSNTKLADLEENVTVAIDLPLVDNSATVTLLSGKLPGGIRVSGSQIVGTPYEVARITDFKFVLRAELNGVIRDRTFTISVSGPDAPIWTTQEGLLPVGTNNTFYILDSSPVDFQLIATDNDLIAGQTLEYYIASGDGELPPGIQLTQDGRLVGIVDPILAIEKTLEYNAGTFDTAPYDFTSAGYDFGLRSSNGFDSFFFDTEIYDFNYPEKTPRKLNRYYQFTVSVSDGDLISRRTFRIYVVGDDFFRADNTIMRVGTGTFTADNTNIRVPIWLTPSNLGVRRANNYVTLFLDVIDPNTLTGFVSYSIVTNPGTYRFSDGATITGRWEISKQFPVHPTNGIQPSINANQMTIGQTYAIVSIGSTNFTQYGALSNTVGSTFRATSRALTEEAAGSGQVKLVDFVALTPETNSELPPGLELDSSSGEIAGQVPYQAEVTRTFTFTIKASRFTPDQDYEVAESSKTFTVKLLGEIDSQTIWITNNDLGTIGSNVISVLRVEATTNVPNANVLYILKSGRLPPGLSLSFDGEIVGKVNAFGENVYRSGWKPSRNYSLNDIVYYDGFFYQAQSTHLSTSTGIFSNDAALWAKYNYTTNGLTVFDNDTFTLDGGTTSVDREYRFTVTAQDIYNYSTVDREFVIKVSDPDTRRYNNVYMKPFLKENVRRNFGAFISDPEIFIPEHIYRPSDPNFGIQREIKMLVYAGIETKEIQNFVTATATNHKRKRFRIGELKTAVAKIPGTNEVVYEVVYLDVIDPYEPTEGRTKKSISINNPNRINVNAVSATPKNTFYDFEEKPQFSVVLRDNRTVNVTLGDQFLVETRNDGSINLVWQDGLEVDTRSETALIEILKGLGPTATLRPTYANVIKVDSSVINASQTSDVRKYITNLTNMRDNIRPIGVTERNFVPLWMRSSQTNSVNELGYTPALVLCYTKPGKSEIIKSAINASGFDFSQFDLDLDRYLLDSTSLSSRPQYILFSNYQFNI